MAEGQGRDSGVAADDGVGRARAGDGDAGQGLVRRPGGAAQGELAAVRGFAEHQRGRDRQGAGHDEGAVLYGGDTGIRACSREDEGAGARFRQVQAGSADASADRERAGVDGDQPVRAQRHRARPHVQGVGADEDEVVVPSLGVVG